jgi:release factor glutamine methyltransferase
MLAGEPLGPGSAVLDLCTGSGLLAVSAALTGAQVVAVDVCRRALVSTRLNARLNGVRVQTRRGDLLAAVAEERFDLIVTNPLYLPGRSKPPSHGLARAWEAGPGGRRLINRICARAPEHLNPGASCCCFTRASAESRRHLRRSGAAGLRRASSSATVDRWASWSRPGQIGWASKACWAAKVSRM